MAASNEVKDQLGKKETAFGRLTQELNEFLHGTQIVDTEFAKGSDIDEDTFAIFYKGRSILVQILTLDGVYSLKITKIGILKFPQKISSKWKEFCTM